MFIDQLKNSYIKSVWAFLFILGLGHEMLMANQPQTVWAVGDGERVLQKDLKHPSKKRNSVWDGKKVNLFAAKNEIVAFQIIVEAGDLPIDGLGLKFSGLENKEGDKITYIEPSTDPTDYVGRSIQLFSLNYVEVPRISKANWIYSSTASRPKGGIGNVPVQIVPENALPGKGGFPLRVSRMSNQAFWVEVYTPENLNAGTYKGDCVLEAGSWTQTIPVELKVFDFALPHENSMSTMFYFEEEQIERYHGKSWLDRYHRFAHRHRIEFTHAYNPQTVEQYKGRFNGDDFTKEKGYEGPGENVGNKIIPRTFYNPRNYFDEQQTAWKNADEWMTFIQANFPKATTFVYMPDEPHRSQYPRIHKLAQNIRSSPGPGKDLKVFVTKGYDQGLDGAVDIWCHYIPSHNPQKAKELRAKGEEVWVYNGTRPHSGALVYETPATDPRATIWSCFKHQIPVYFYWHVNHWYHNSQKPIDRYQNVWSNAVTFDNRLQKNKAERDKGYINGDGVVLYPGEDIRFPYESRGIEGPCSSIRLANFRRGLQDHLYLTMALKISSQKVNQALKKIVPTVLGEVRSGNIGFETRSDRYEEMRLMLAKLIEKKHKKR